MRSNNRATDSWQNQTDELLTYTNMTNMLISIGTLSSWPIFIALLASTHASEGVSTMLSTAKNINKRKEEEECENGWEIWKDVADFASGLAILLTGVAGIGKVAEAVETTNLVSYMGAIHFIAMGQAIKSALNFITATVDLLNSTDTEWEDETEEDKNEFDQQIRKVLFHGLKTIGYILISYGAFPAGAAYLGAALAVALYDSSPLLQKYCSSIATFFSRPSSSAAERTPLDDNKSPQNTVRALN